MKASRHLLKPGAMAVLTVISLCFTVHAQAPGDLRIALVIGNSAYAAAPLLNPVNDARAMGTTLRGLGFTVIVLQDADRQQMADAVSRMRELLQGKRGVGMLYYAGHGLQLDWQNFMVPVDAKLSTRSELPSQTVGVNSVIEAFRSAGNRMNILVLDACRDNPLEDKVATKGLAPVDAPPGTFMAFATTAGNVAEDGDEASGNGLYTQFLLEELKKPAARLEDVFKRVKFQVRQKSQGRQVPADSSNLDEEFSFDAGFARAAPDSEPVRIARFNLEKNAWDRIKTSAVVDDFFAFLQRYPNGFFSEIAQFRADQIKAPVLVAQLTREGIPTLTGGANRFSLGDTYTLTTTDLLTKLSRSIRQNVTFADSQRVEINNGTTVYDQMGGLIKDDSGVKDPAMLLVPADMALGKKWRSSFQNRIGPYDARTFVDFRVVALEDLDSGGQTAKVFRVEMDGFATVSAGSALFKGTVWIEPRTMRMVRYDRQVSAGSRLIDATRIEITGYTPAPRS